jgi:hypothetical protein
MYEYRARGFEQSAVSILPPSIEIVLSMKTMDCERDENAHFRPQDFIVDLNRVQLASPVSGAGSWSHIPMSSSMNCFKELM